MLLFKKGIDIYYMYEYFEGVNLPVKILVIGNIQTQNKYNGDLMDRKALKILSVELAEQDVKDMI